MLATVGTAEPGTPLGPRAFTPVPMPADHPRTGLLCPPDHEVFAEVADRLAGHGHEVVFLDPETEVPTERLDALDLLVNKKVRWATFHALEYAYRNGIPAWNDYVTSMLFSNRLAQLTALSAVGFATPAVHVEKPDGDYVAKGFLDITGEPRLNGEGDWYEELLAFDGTDHKYYAVDVGGEIAMVVNRYDSKLFGERTFLERGEVDPTVAERVRRLMRFTGARSLGVDLVLVDGEPHALDVNPAPSFRHTGLAGAIADSIDAAARGG